MRAETQRAIDAPEQAAVLPRLRDQERAEETERRLIENDLPTGPQPTFEETPLQRHARAALEPPDPIAGRDDAMSGVTAASGNDKPAEPPPGPRERAEVSFAETRSLAVSPEGAAVDIAR